MLKCRSPPISTDSSWKHNNLVIKKGNIHCQHWASWGNLGYERHFWIQASLLQIHGNSSSFRRNMSLSFLHSLFSSPSPSLCHPKRNCAFWESRNVNEFGAMVLSSGKQPCYPTFTEIPLLWRYILHFWITKQLLLGVTSILRKIFLSWTLFSVT